MDTLALWVADSRSQLVRVDATGQSAGEYTLDLGWRELSGWPWPAGTASPGQIEHAIDLVEEALQPRAGWAKGAGVLSLDAESFGALLSSLPVSASGEASDACPEAVERDAIEAGFRTLADAAHGSTVARAQRGGATPRADALLLLMREITHHWDIARVVRGAV